MGYLIALLVFFSAPAFAKCETEVTLDQEFTELRAERRKDGISDSEYKVRVTQLLNSAFTPYLIKLKELVKTIPVSELRSMAKDLKESIKPFDIHRELKADAGPYDFDALFTGHESAPYPRRQINLRASYTGFNKSPMRQLLVAAMTMVRIEQLYLWDNEPSSILESEELRDSATFARTNLPHQMYYAYLSVLQSAAAFTADPISGWSAEAMLKDVMSPGPECLSVVVMHSLIAPPRLLGEYGTEFYRRNPVEDHGSGRLTMSRDFREFMKHHRENFPVRAHSSHFEHLKGCPVAHKSPGLDQPGLQHFLDAIMYVYGVLK